MYRQCILLQTRYQRNRSQVDRRIRRQMRRCCHLYNWFGRCNRGTRFPAGHSTCLRHKPYWSRRRSGFDFGKSNFHHNMNLLHNPHHIHSFLCRHCQYRFCLRHMALRCCHHWSSFRQRELLPGRWWRLFHSMLSRYRRSQIYRLHLRAIHYSVPLWDRSSRWSHRRDKYFVPNNWLDRHRNYNIIFREYSCILLCTCRDLDRKVGFLQGGAFEVGAA
jgi:hypothetical protein